ncbi:unknown [Mycoplasma sp. CAG:956]|nr:unknown [Mycoplasma sp. CAG:956]
MKIYQILLLIGVILASIATSFYLVKMISLLLKSKNSKKITDKELDNDLKYMVISIVLLTICSLVYCITSIMS